MDGSGCSHRHQHDLIGSGSLVEVLQAGGDLWAGAVDEAARVAIEDLLIEHLRGPEVMRLLCSPGRTRDCAMPLCRRRAAVPPFAAPLAGEAVRPVAVTECGPPVPMRRRGYRPLEVSASGARERAAPGCEWRGGSCGGSTRLRMAVRRL